jgi:CDP-diacylglycerol--glycerol-3-phosphate 3-phosphatidyltransferase
MWTISNIISLSRIIASIPLGYCVYIDNIPGIVILTFLTMFSDFLDGYFARKFNQITELGKILDPIGDKMCVAMTALALLFNGKIPVWFFLALVLRDLLIVAGSYYVKNKIKFVLPSNLLGKITVNIISLVLIGVIFNYKPASDYGFYIAFAAAVISLVVYTIRMFQGIIEAGRKA